MKHSSTILSFAFASLITAFFAENVQAEHNGKVQILLLGDSTTEGSVPRRLKPKGPHLERVLEMLLAAEGDLQESDVINSSLSGEYIRRLIDSGRYARDASKLPGIDYIIVRYGLNDRGRRDDFDTNFPLDYYELIGMLRRDHPHALVIPSTVIPFSGDEASKRMNDLIRQVAAKEQLDVFDIYPGYAAALAAGPNMLNYRRYPVTKIPEKYQPLVKPYLFGDRVEVMDNELDAILGHLPGWYSDRHPNLAGYNVIARQTADYISPLIRARKKQTLNLQSSN